MKHNTDRDVSNPLPTQILDVLHPGRANVPKVSAIPDRDLARVFGFSPSALP
jgi:hypothetical protein